MKMDTKPTTDIAQCVEKIFTERQKNRRPLEVKWQQNWENYKRIAKGDTFGDEDDPDRKDEESWRSKIVPAITKQKIVAAVSLVCDQVLAGGKVPISIQESPEDMIYADEMEDADREQAEEAIEEMQYLTTQQLADTQSDKVYARGVLSGAIFGEAWSKQTAITTKRSKYVEIPETISDDPSTTRWEKLVQEIDGPGLEYRSVWDIFYDIEHDSQDKYGLQSCQGILERALMSPYDLRQLKGMDYYYDDAIDRAIKQHGDSDSSIGGEDTSSMRPGLRDLASRNKTIRVLEYWGRLPRRAVESFVKHRKQNRTNDEPEPEMESSSMDEEQGGDEVEVMVVVAGGEVIRFAKTEPDDRPYFRAIWEEDLDSPGGIGVADNTEDAQEMMTNFARQFIDNKRLSGNVMLGVKQRFLLDPITEVKPGMVLDIAEDCEDVRQAIQQVQINDIGQTLLDAIQLAMQFADDDSGIPRVQQGGKNGGAETAFELNQRLEKSGKYLAKVVSNYDDGFLEPWGAAILDWNMDDPECPATKGNYVARATGFSSFQNRLTKLEGLSRLFQFALSNEDVLSRIDIDKMLKAYAELLDQDPDDVLIPIPKAGEEEPPSEAEVLQMEGVRAEVNLKKAQTQRELNEIEMERRKVEIDEMKLEKEIEKELIELGRTTVPNDEVNNKVMASFPRN
jgi:hypothetical protein